jgi:hypothetical protein
MSLRPTLLELEVPEHRPGFFDDLRNELRPRASRIARRRLLLVAAVAAIVGGALAFGLTRGSEVASAAHVQAIVERAFASNGSISGILVTREGMGAEEPVGRERFVISSTGAFRFDGIGSPYFHVYDPTKNVDVSANASSYTRSVGISGGGSPFGGMLGLGSAVANLADAQGSTVENVTYEGRPAWLLRTSGSDPRLELLLTVDRATGIPVREQVLIDGRLVGFERIEGLRVSATEPRITLPSRTRRQSLHVFDGGFRRMSLAEARGAAGYSPLVPNRLPAGFRLVEAGFAPGLRTPYFGFGNPPARAIISLIYRRGFDEIVVSTQRTRTKPPSAWKDPLQTSPTTPEPITFTGGALAGQRGHLVIATDVLPHVWTAGPELVVTVSGTVDGADLLEVANSLQSVGG